MPSLRSTELAWDYEIKDAEAIFSLPLPSPTLQFWLQAKIKLNPIPMFHRHTKGKLTGYCLCWSMGYVCSLFQLKLYSWPSYLNARKTLMKENKLIQDQGDLRFFLIMLVCWISHGSQRIPGDIGQGVPCRQAFPSEPWGAFYSGSSEPDTILSHKTTHVTHPGTALQRALLKRQDIAGKTHAFQDLGRCADVVT